MKYSFPLIASILLASFNISAQDLPQPSPSATVSQRIGLTDFTVKYSRPSMKDRTIFGELVPYGQLWRTGANSNTTITFNTEIKIGENMVNAGTYSLFTIPNEDECMIILNSKTDYWGTGDFAEDENVLTFEIPVFHTESMTETFTIGFEDIAANTGELFIEWANYKVEIPVEVKVEEIAQRNIDDALKKAKDDTKWQVYRNAANYYHNSGLEGDLASKYIELNGKSWYSYWLKAEILAGKQNFKEAVQAAEMAKTLGEKEASAKKTEFAYAGMIDQSIAKWKRTR